jgi:TolA-binding protein
MNRLTALLLALLLPGLARALTAPEQQQFADGLYSRGMHDLAIQEYLRLLGQFPTYEKVDVVLYRLAEAYRKTGKAAEAFTAYAKLSGGHPQSALVHRARLRMVELKVAAEDLNGALSIIGQLLGDKPGGEVEAATLYYQGVCLQKSGRGEAARVAYQQLVDRFAVAPHAGYARIELAKMAAAAGGGGDAQVEALYKQSAEQPPSPRAGQEAWSALVDFYYQRQRHADAAGAFAELRRRHPDAAPAVELWLKTAWALFHTQQFQASLDLLAAAPAELAQRFGADVLYLQANGLRQTRREAEAIAAYAELARQHPQSEYAPYASYETALVAYQQKKFETVIAQAEQMMREPKLALDATWLYARALEQVGRPADAVGQFARLAQQFADSPRAPEALYEAGRLEQDAQRWAEAAGHFRALADRFPKHELAGQARYAAAVCEVKRDRLEAAVEDWTRLLKDHPWHELATESLFQRGQAEMKLQRKEAARASFAALLGHAAAEPRQVGEASYWLALLLEQDKQFAEAEGHLRTALAKLGQHEWTPKIQYRLALVLQKQEKFAESADLVQGILESPVAGELDPALLEWLVRRRLEEKAHPAAARAAGLMARNARDPRWKQLAFALGAQAQIALQQPAEAAALYQQALGIPVESPERAEAALFVGDHMLTAKKPAEATARFEEASALGSQLGLPAVQARGILGLGRAAEARQEFDAAARFFMSVAVLYDDPALSPEALHRAARAYRALQREADAERTVGELKTRYPDSPWASRPLDG